MLNFRSLYSGSTGNSLFVESNNTKILVDSGVSLKKLTSALSSNDISISDIDAVIVTHEHSDHVQSLGMLSSKYNIPVYANEKTWDAMPKQRESIDNINQKTFKSYEKFEIGDLTVDPFSIPHDAADPCGFNIINNNDKISIATDIDNWNKIKQEFNNKQKKYEYIDEPKELLEKLQQNNSENNIEKAFGNIIEYS